MPHKYILPLLDAFEAQRNASYAVNMKSYMKDQFEYYGIRSPIRREIQKNHFKSHGLPKRADIEGVVKECWGRKEREMHYFGMEVLDKYLRKNDEVFIELIEYMVVNKSWWDTVDGIASWLIGTTFKRHPELIVPQTRKWMDSGNIWLQRCCLLFQLKYKKTTDTELLYSYILELADNKTFWIRKAIGWILREYSKTNPDAVIEFVNKHQLSNLSRNEALKVINRKS